MLIALSFAEVGSRFDGTGGPYLYTRAAFGRFAAFEVGWMLWFTRAASWAAVINVSGHRLWATTGRGFDDRPAAVGVHHADHRGDRRDQHPRHPAEQHRRQRAHRRQAGAAGVFIVAGLFAIDVSRLATISR